MEAEALKVAKVNSENVFYGKTDMVVRATVERVHRDGTTTVLAWHFLDDSGKSIPGFLGYRYRVENNYLRAAA